MKKWSNSWRSPIEFNWKTINFKIYSNRIIWLESRLSCISIFKKNKITSKFFEEDKNENNFSLVNEKDQIFPTFWWNLNKKQKISIPFFSLKNIIPNWVFIINYNQDDFYLNFNGFIDFEDISKNINIDNNSNTNLNKYKYNIISSSNYNFIIKKINKGFSVFTYNNFL